MSDELKLQTKVCSSCCERKLLEDFSNRKDTKDNKHYICKDCANKYRQIHRRKHPDIVKDESLRRTFGINLEQYKALLSEQKGVCAICSEPETSTYKGKLRHLSVDHCHTTGRNRSLLCNDCNVALGWFKDDVKRLRSAIHYLDSWS